MPSPLTTTDILRYLPLDEQVRSRIFARYPDGLSYEQCVEIEELAWDMYYALYEMRYERCLKDKILAAGESSAEMSDQAHVQVSQEILSEMTTQQSSSQIDLLRHRIQRLSAIGN